jgi:hypothetical protein
MAKNTANPKNTVFEGSQRRYAGVTVGHLDESHVAQADVRGPDFQNVTHDRRRVGVAQQIS